MFFVWPCGNQGHLNVQGFCKIHKFKKKKLNLVESRYVEPFAQHAFVVKRTKKVVTGDCHSLACLGQLK